MTPRPDTSPPEAGSLAAVQDKSACVSEAGNRETQAREAGSEPEYAGLAILLREQKEYLCNVAADAITVLQARAERVEALAAAQLRGHQKSAGDATRHLIERNEARRALAAAERKVKELSEALAPFAKLNDPPDSEPPPQFTLGDNVKFVIRTAAGGEYDFKKGDLRRAAAALGTASSSAEHRETQETGR